MFQNEDIRHQVRHPAWRAAFKRLDAALKTPHFDHRERIRLMREAAFADVDELEASGRLIIPTRHPKQNYPKQNL